MNICNFAIEIMSLNDASILISLFQIIWRAWLRRLEPCCCGGFPAEKWSGKDCPAAQRRSEGHRLGLQQQNLLHRVLVVALQGNDPRWVFQKVKKSVRFLTNRKSKSLNDQNFLTENKFNFHYFGSRISLCLFPSSLRPCSSSTEKSKEIQSFSLLNILFF